MVILLLFLGTHSDAKQDQWKSTPESLQRLMQIHKNIVHITTVSSVTLKGIKELQKEIVTVALKQVRAHSIHTMSTPKSCLPLYTAPHY